MKKVTVSLNDRSYDIAMGPWRTGLIPALKKRGFESTTILLVSSQALHRAGHVDALRQRLVKSGYRVATSLLPDGEAHKTLSTVSRLYREGFRAGLDRSSMVIGLGGGVVTDMAGFFASTYMRGISLVSIPTTLLGMVDAAIGGKTGVDVPEGKNLVGSFWQPACVWIDLTFLKTLPEREWRTGFAEILKYGVIKRPDFFDWLQKKTKAQPVFSRWPLKDIANAVWVSVATKADVVGRDERETPLKGGREILNFGHTIGHALEAALGYGRLSHGEAISIGMIAAGRIALVQGLWSDREQDRLFRLIDQANLPTAFPRLTASQSKLFWSALRKDKKNVGGTLRFVLPVRMGTVIVKSGIPASLIKTILKQLL